MTGKYGHVKSAYWGGNAGSGVLIKVKYGRRLDSLTDRCLLSRTQSNRFQVGAVECEGVSF